MAPPPVGFESTCAALGAVDVASFPNDAGPAYGTAGFRYTSALLDGVCFRTGAMVAAVSHSEGGAIAGLMITASHNPPEDNGVKVCTGSGEMVSETWEKRLESMCRAPDAQKAADVLADAFAAHGTEAAAPLRVMVGRDTRTSGEKLAGLAVKGIEAAGARAMSVGTVTTPQLHWLVQKGNAGEGSFVEDYHAALASAYVRLCDATPGDAPPTLAVDCAHGVGAPQLKALLAAVAEANPAHALPATLVNHDVNATDDSGKSRLNSSCGADFVQKEKVLPTVTAAESDEIAARAAASWCSLDGDADRIVYYAPPASGTNHVALLDGDRIAILHAMELARDLDDIVARHGDQTDHALGTIGVVQTAYANGGSTAYLRTIPRVSIAKAKTGVKHLHHVAVTKYDISVYFEANGHGAVLFSERAVARLRELAAKEEGEGGGLGPAGRMLLYADGLINQAVGDAYSALLFVSLALRRRGWTIADWLALYDDLPSKQAKAKVPDRSKFVTEKDDEAICVKPAGLQAKIDALVMGAGEGARAFVRPSGTEDVVRVYSEAATEEAMSELAAQLTRLVVTEGEAAAAE